MEEIIELLKVNNALLAENNQLLQTISSSLPDTEYRAQLYDTSVLLRSYLDTEIASEEVSEEEAESLRQERERFLRIEESLKSIDEKTVKAETNTLSEEGYAEANGEVLDSLTALNEEVKLTSSHLQNIENIQIPMLCGVGMIFGVVCAVIFSRFLHH